MYHLINPAMQLNLKEIIADIAKEYRLKTDEAIRLLPLMEFDTKPVNKTTLSFFDLAQTPEREWAQSFSSPTRDKNKHYIAFGLKFMVSNAAHPTSTDVQTMDFRLGFDYKIAHGRLSIKCGDQKYLDNFKMSEFQNGPANSFNHPSMPSTFMVLPEPVIWFSEKKLEFDIDLPQESLPVSPADPYWLRPMFWGIALD